MLPVVVGLVVGTLVLASSHKGKASPEGAGDDKGKTKPKGARKLDAQASFLEGKKAAKAELEAEAAKKAADDAAFELEVDKRIKAREAAAKTTPPPAAPKSEGAAT